MKPIIEVFWLDKDRRACGILAREHGRDYATELSLEEIWDQFAEGNDTRHSVARDLAVLAQVVIEDGQASYQAR